MTSFDAFAARARPSDDELLQPGADAPALRALLAATEPAALTPAIVRAHVEGHLTQLAPAAFRYFLPALLRAAAEDDPASASFAAEMIRALVPPERADLEAALDDVAAIPAVGLAPDILTLLRAQQLARFDRGVPQADFRARFEPLTDDERAVVRSFLVEMRDCRGADFPVLGPDVALARYWDP